MSQEAGRLEVEPSRQRALAHRQQGGGENYGGQRRGEVQPPGPEGVKKREREGRADEEDREHADDCDSATDPA